MPLALQYGLTVFDFWDMTIKEINAYIKAIQQREKQKRMDQYLQASLVANFVGSVFNGKPIPPIHEVFPELFIDETSELQKEKDYQAMMLYKEQMIDFANKHNKIRQVIKEGENIDD